MAADFYVNTLKRKKKTTRYFIDGLEISSDDSDEFDEEQINIASFLKKVNLCIQNVL